MAVETQHVHLQDDGWGIPVTGFLHGELSNVRGQCHVA